MINNNENIISSRDVIDRISELAELEDPDEAEIYELRQLRKLADHGEESREWRRGETLIRDSYFRDYAEDLARDCGLVDDSAAWPMNCIDWEKAARELKQDYRGLIFNYVVYWVRG